MKIKYISLNFKTNFQHKKDKLFFLHTLGNEISDSFHVKDNIYFGGNFNEMLHLIEHGRVKQTEIRFFVGWF